MIVPSSARLWFVLVVAVPWCTGIGAAAAAAVPTTRAAAPAGPAVVCRIALLSDPHVSDNRRYSDYVANFSRTISEVNADPCDAVLVVGDLTQNFNAASARQFRNLASGLQVAPLYVAGNHDLGNKPQPGKPATVTEARAREFQQSVGPLYYATDLTPDVHLVAISSALFGTGLASERAQWDFLECALTRRRPGVTLVLSHYPAFVHEADEPDDYWNVNLSCRPRFLSLLQRGGVTAVLSGHLHRPLDTQWRGVSFIGAPAISFGLPPGKQGVGWRLVLVHVDGSVTSELRYLPPPATRPAADVNAELLKSPADARVRAVDLQDPAAAATQPARAAAGVETIVFLRHGEKPPAGCGQLTPRGFNRAIASSAVLPKMFGVPDYLFAPDPQQELTERGTPYNYVRALAAIEPTAIRYGLPVHTPCGFGNFVALDDELVKPAYAHATVFVAWEHENEVRAAQRLLKMFAADAAVVPAWPGKDYDSLYVIRITRSAGTAPTAVFTHEHEGLDRQSTAMPVPAPP